MEVLLQIGLLVIGFVMLIKGADWFVEGASKIADKLGIPQLVIGLTIVAMGTSAPETAVSISAALKGSADIAVGNVVGSNIMNILVILGITSIIIPLSVQKSTVKYEIPFMIIITVIFAVLGLTDNEIFRGDGLILLGLFIIYLAYLFRMAKKGQAVTEEVEEDGKQDSVLKMIVLIVIGVVLIVLGSNVSVDAAKTLATIFGMDEKLIGLTIVALGTSLPELVTSVTAGLKGKADIAIGNIVGSNIFNILLVIGVSAMITPVTYQAAFLFDSIVCVAAAVLLFVCVLNKDNKLKRWSGITMLVGYAAYLGYMIVNM
ncbi:MAG: calcium/sodium antiporter [Lachnospiraceae bacterium]|nr:calcium/sodium antiporter [Lachnospiraceae bacterium]